MLVLLRVSSECFYQVEWGALVLLLCFQGLGVGPDA